jgi:hypothetical protein
VPRPRPRASSVKPKARRPISRVAPRRHRAAADRAPSNVGAHRGRPAPRRSERPDDERRVHSFRQRTSANTAASGTATQTGPIAGPRPSPRSAQGTRPSWATTRTPRFGPGRSPAPRCRQGPAGPPTPSALRPTRRRSRAGDGHDDSDRAPRTQSRDHGSDGQRDGGYDVHQQRSGRPGGSTAVSSGNTGGGAIDGRRTSRADGRCRRPGQQRGSSTTIGSPDQAADRARTRVGLAPTPRRCLSGAPSRPTRPPSHACR